MLNKKNHTPNGFLLPKVMDEYPVRFLERLCPGAYIQWWKQGTGA